MCLPALPAIMAVASAVATSAGAIVQGQAQEAAMKQRAQQYRSQAELDNRQANLTQIQGQYEQRRKQEQLSSGIATQRAGYAAQGVDMSGTAADVILNTRREGELDIAAIRYGADIKTRNLRYSSAMNQNNAISADNAAKTTRTATMIGAIAPLLNAGAKIAGMPGTPDAGGGAAAAAGVAEPMRINDYAPDYLKKRTRLGLNF